MRQIQNSENPISVDPIPVCFRDTTGHTKHDSYKDQGKRYGFIPNIAYLWDVALVFHLGHVKLT